MMTLPFRHLRLILPSTITGTGRVMKSILQIFLVTFTFIVVSSVTFNENEHILVKRQSQPLPPRSLQRSIPLSRSRQFPPPEELEELSPNDSSDAEDETSPPVVNPPARRPASRFRGRQPVSPAELEEDVNNTPASPTTTPAPEKSAAAPGRASRFGLNRPRLQINSPSQTPKPVDTTSAKPAPPASNSGASSSRSRSRLSPRADTGLDILSRTPPPRSQNKPTASSSAAKETPSPNVDVETRRSGTGRVRARGRLRTRTSSTTTTTTTTTTKAPSADDYYYYYYDDEEESLEKQPIATTTSTTTTTTRAPSVARRPASARRPGNARPSGVRPSSSTVAPRSDVKFDPDSQFVPPPEDVEDTTLTERSTRKYTTSTTASPGPGGIPAHLAHKYKPRKDGRFVDYFRDPNRPRELKGFDLTDYPFYIKVPDDITFDCEDKKDGYYASVPHHCQLFHYCFAGARYDFLCANYTLYDQTTFTCRFANNVDCPSSESFYYRNDDLWKETTSTSTTPEPKKKKKKDNDDDYDGEEYYDYEDEEDDEEEERRRRPKRRRNRGRKNSAKSS